MKRGEVLLVVGLVFILLIGASLVSATCPSGLVSYWTFDNADVDISTDKVYDIAGNNDGTNNGATSTIGQVNQAFDFNTDYVSLPSGTHFSTEIPKNSWTIVSWFNANSVDGTYYECRNPIINFADTQHRGKVELGISSTGIEFCYSNSAGTRKAVKVNDNLLNEWHFYAVTYDGTRFKTYIDDQLKNTITDSFFGFAGGYDDTSIGIKRPGEGGSWAFHGKIDEVAIFNRPLTAAEVLTLYDKGLAGDGYCEEAVACECSTGAEKCEGRNYHTCDDGCHWTDKGEVIGKCGVTSPTSSCLDNDRIMKLFQPSNSDGALWNQAYTYDICYSKIFGEEYAPAIGEEVHACNENRVLSLFDTTNAHASVEHDADYDQDVCYGDLDCEVRNNDCAAGQEMVVALYSEDNSHITDPYYTPDGMVSWWNFDKGLETTSYDVLENNDLTLHNTLPASIISGKIGKAIEFDGSTIYLEADNDASLNPTSALTLEAWINPNDNNNIGAVIKKTDSSGNKGYALEGSEHVTSEQNTFRFALYNGICSVGAPEPAGWCFTDSTPSLTNGQWYHLIGTYDGSNMKLYLDGELISTKPVSGNIISSSNSLMIGKDPGNPSATNRFFKGTIDDVAIYNRALTPEEVQHRYNMGTYEKKICCRTEDLGKLYWTDMEGKRISEADINDSVLMVYEDAGFNYDFQVLEDDPDSDDPIRVGANAIASTLIDGNAVAMITITDEDFKNGNDGVEMNDGHVEFYFMANGGKVSTLLLVGDGEDNAKPEIDISYPGIYLPIADRRFQKGMSNIPFEIEVRDEDDLIDVDWYFGDGGTDSSTCPLSLDGCEIAKEHHYDSTGTKQFHVIAREAEREQEAENYTLVFIYDYGTNIFPIITKPELNWKFPSGTSEIEFNGSGSYVAKCPVSGCGGEEDCYPVVDLSCYDLSKEDIPAEYNLWFNWSIQDISISFGNWNGNYDDAVEFNETFDRPGEHQVDLKVGYEEK